MRTKCLKMRRLCAAMLLALLCVFGIETATVYANVDEAAVEQAEAEAQAQTEAPATEAPAETQPVIDRGGTETETTTPFSVPGNGEVLDDISGDSTKEFYTIRTANNNTFYMVIDKSSTTENVYMLSLIDEGDLQEFLDETEKETEAVIPPVVIEENTDKETEPETTAVQQPEKKGTGNAAGFAVIGILALAGIAAYYFLKIRPGKEAEETDSENLEMDDGLEVINEDADENPENEE